MPSVTVVGSVNLDLVATCARLPRPGETITALEWARYPGGKGANQALAAQRAGATVSLIGAVGQDDFATEALTLLRASSIDLSRVVPTTQQTGLALIVVDAAGENQIVVIPGANAFIDAEAVDTSGAEIVLCQLEVSPEVVEAAVRTATGLVCINAAPARALSTEVMDRADVVIVNETEQTELSHTLESTSALVVVTLGAAGAKAFRSGRLVAEAQPPAVTPVDTVGAGDAFCGALVHALGEGKSVLASLEWACAAGALATTRRGAQSSLPDAAAIDAAVR